jgi:hypothetical protein
LYHICNEQTSTDSYLDREIYYSESSDASPPSGQFHATVVDALDHNMEHLFGSDNVKSKQPTAGNKATNRGLYYVLLAVDTVY